MLDVIYHAPPGLMVHRGGGNQWAITKRLRHGTLTPEFVSSNLTSPVCGTAIPQVLFCFSYFHLRSSSQTGLIKGTSNVPEDFWKLSSVVRATAS